MSKTIGQKFAYFFSMLFFAGVIACIVGLFVYHRRSANDGIYASLLASTAFCLGSGIVLYVIATTRLRGILAFPSAEDSK